MPGIETAMDDSEAPLDLSKMKKKSKKAPPSFLTEGDDASGEPAKDAVKGGGGGADEGSLNFKGMKKKKKPAINLDELGQVEPLGDSKDPSKPDGPKDLSYEELLDRVYNIMREKNPNVGEKKQFVIKPPEVVKAGAKKTSFVNFLEISKAMNREPKHFLTFILAELGTSGSIDGNNTLILKGKFQGKQMENILRRYIKEYVMCHTCKSSDTKLQKSDRLQFLQCESCQSRCTVASIRTGFQAVTGKRAAARAKEV